MALFEAFIAFFFSLLLYYFFTKKLFDFLHIKKTLDANPLNWPIFGMLLDGLVRLHWIFDWSVVVLENHNLSFLFKGVWFAKMDIFFTVDPANIHHILSSNFSNYIKGHEFKEIFDVYGDAVFNTDSNVWKNIRMTAQGMLNHREFQRKSMSNTTSKLKDELIPLFNQFAEEEKVFDLQNLFGRFIMDLSLAAITGSDPKSLSIESPDHVNEFAKALDTAAEVLTYRHILPGFIWKMQNRMGLLQEKRMIEAGATFDRFCSKYVSIKREEVRTHGGKTNGEFEDVLTSFIKIDTKKYEFLDPSSDKFIRDMFMGFVVAMRDTTTCALTWFFWFLSQNPKVVTKIRQEIDINLISFEMVQEKKEFLNNLVYLQAALQEAMRLYPPVPFERKSPLKPDVLPSGHEIAANSNVMIPIYALGRMKMIWGEDATEFRPERWISETGGLKHEPSYKFLVFNAGPRTCVGKNLGMVMMKAMVVEILQNFDINVIKGQKIEPKHGLMLYMKHGLKVTISKRIMSNEILKMNLF